MGNKHLAGTVRNADRWKALELELKGTVQPSAGIAILTYEWSDGKRGKARAATPEEIGRTAGLRDDTGRLRDDVDLSKGDEDGKDESNND